MDVEAELIRSQDWSELKRFYSARSGYTWELAWITLRESPDPQRAIVHFQNALRDPRYEEAAWIMLWKLGKRPLARPREFPQSLRYYEAYENRDWAPLCHYLKKSSENEKFAASLLERALPNLSEFDLTEIEKIPRTAKLNGLLGNHADRKLKSSAFSKKFFKSFYQDPWVHKALEEIRRRLLDAETSKKIIYAYSHRDGITLQRILKAVAARLAKLKNDEDGFSREFKDAMKEVIHWDLKHLSENMFGYSFWNDGYEWSSTAIYFLVEKVFAAEPHLEPDFISFWRSFFSSSELTEIPSTLDPNSLSLWQIRVEMNSRYLTEALLRFPMEERFLFLWSLRNRDHQVQDPRRWPENERESSVVRKNLERAFDRSSNKVLWFDRLRQVGCSQDFYEYAVQRAPIPLGWVLEDLKKNFIQTSVAIRDFIKSQLALAAPTTTELIKALSYLTPAESQEVLLSRFVLVGIPEEILNDSYLDLAWDARHRIRSETFEKWEKSVLDYISKIPRLKLNSHHWRWILYAWDRHSDSLDRFSPTLESGIEFPWEDFLEKLDFHGKQDLLLTCLARVPDDRLKEKWIEAELARGQDHRIFTAIQSLHTDYIRNGLLSVWYEMKGDIRNAIHSKEAEFGDCPILNDQIRIARETIKLYRKSKDHTFSEVLAKCKQVAEFLERNASIDKDLSREMAEICEGFSDWEGAWKWRLQEWNASDRYEQEASLKSLLDLAFRGRLIADAQRLFIDHVFHKGEANSLTYEILNVLLNPDSDFRIQHIRSEFVQRVSQLFPLHPELLRARAAEDYRGVLLWESFYGGDLEARAAIPTFNRKRRYDLWQLTESAGQIETISPFAKYMDALPLTKIEGIDHEFLNKAQRTSERLFKCYGMKKAFRINILEKLETPFRISFAPHQLDVQVDFFNELDEESWGAITVGVLQLLHDREQGLFDSKRLMERFFQGMLLSGAPISKLIRLWVWLAIYEGMIEPQILKTDPETLIKHLPFINSLIIFYLSPDFAHKTGGQGT